MRYGILVGALAMALALPGAQAVGQAQGTGTALGTVNLPHAAMADGQRLAAGSYQVRLTSERPQPAAGQSPEASQYVEFLSGDRVAGRALATVIAQADIAAVAKGPRPAANGSRVEMLRGDDYLRVWINRGGVNYLIHLPPA
jgi:hypothetical protein